MPPMDVTAYTNGGHHTEHASSYTPKTITMRGYDNAAKHPSGGGATHEVELPARGPLGSIAMRRMPPRDPHSCHVPLTAAA